MLAVITWGVWSERAVSLRSGHATTHALINLWYHTKQYDFPSDRDQFLKDRHDIQGAWMMIHGQWGEDGQICSFLEVLNIPYQCAPSHTLALTIDKRLTKQLWRYHGIPIAQDSLVNVHQDKPTRSCPCVLKALNKGSSIGVIICRDQHSFEQGLEHMKSYGTIMIEELLEWSECTVSIVDDLNAGEPIIFPIVQIIPPAWGFDYENKYNGTTQELCPAPYDDILTNKIQQIWLQAYQACWCTRYGRIDIIVTDRGPVCLEINTIPGFTDQSLFPKAAQTYGRSFEQLVRHLTQLMTQ